MNPKLHSEMLKATQLTREGRLGEAMRLIQRLLKNGPSDAAGGTHETRPPTGPAPVTIDGTATRIEDEEPVGPSASATATPSGADAPQGHDAFGRPGPSKAREGLGAALARIGKSARQRPLNPVPAVPPGARFLARSFTGSAGSRDYKLYVPSSYAGSPLPLIVMLHGCTQSVDDFAAGTRMNEVAEEKGLLVAYPSQSQSANGSRCWNWFKPEDQRRDAGEPSLIAGITGDIAAAYEVDASRIYVAGLSAGGAAAAIMGAAYPDLYAAIGVHSGLPVGSASDLPSALAAMRQGRAGARPRGASVRSSRMPRSVPAIVFHGDRDSTVHPSNGAHIVEQIRSARTSELRAVTRSERASTGRAYSRTSHVDTEDRSMIEMWLLHGAGHAWSGGSATGSYTDPDGPDASREMARFFLQHALPQPSPQ